MEGEVIMLLPAKMSSLAIRFAQEGRVEEALSLFESVLVAFSNPQPSVDIWRYGELLSKNRPILVSCGGIATLELFCKKLTKAIETSRESDTVVEDYSYRWRPAIENHSQNGPRATHEVESILISTVRDAAEQIVQEQKASVQEVVHYLENKAHSIFHRIVLYLLRIFAYGALDLVSDCLSNRKEFDNFDSYHEYVLLLQACFAHVSSHIQSGILQWISEGPNVEAYKLGYKKWMGHEPTGEMVAAYQDTWRRDWLSFISDTLPSFWLNMGLLLTQNSSPTLQRPLLYAREARNQRKS